MDMPRRAFLKSGAVLGAGLILAFHLPIGSAALKKRALDAAGGDFMPNAFIRIGADDSVTVIVKHLEMGQGVFTGLPTLIAEELDASWEQIRVVAAPARVRLYKNLVWPVQATVQSTSMANSYAQLRRAGATARAMLIAAAAEQWRVAVDEIRIQDGMISHPGSGHSAGFGELSARAAQMPVPTEVTLKRAEDFRFIGMTGKTLCRKDGPAKVDGSAVYTIDVRQAGMLTALVAHPPLFGATLKGYSAVRSLAIPGVLEVVPIPTGVAVLAKGFWPAMQGRDALDLEWDCTATNTLGSDEIMAAYRDLAKTPGVTVVEQGETGKALARSAQRLTAACEFPYLAHAPMEPMDCAMTLHEGSCELWHGEQFQTMTQLKISSLLGLELDQVRINMLYAGGSFGRRGNPQADFQAEAAHILKAISGRVPIKLLWTREDDMRAGFYRPLNHHRLEAGLDAQGRLIAWHHRIVGQSILAGTPLEQVLLQKGIDPMSVDGARDMPYRIPNRLLDLHSPETGVPVLWWRSVGHTHTAFSIETFMDEVAEAAGSDPVEFRRILLEGHPRLLRVLDLVAEKSGWGKPLPQGHGRGIALHQCFDTCVAQVAEVSVTDAGKLKVAHVTCAVDCGLAINPQIIEAQMQGGIGFGLTATLKGAITLKNGKVEQSNFHDYPLLRIDEMPRVEVHIVPSSASPTGVGEPGVPPIAPAVCNAIYMAAGKRIRSLPVPQTISS